MPDPHKALAPIIEPSAPPLVPEIASVWPDVALTGLIVVLFIALAVWLWRRSAPQRALRRIARADDARSGADQLANWIRAQRIQPAQEWRLALERLRFGLPTADAAAQLAKLCLDLDRHSRARGSDYK